LHPRHRLFGQATPGPGHHTTTAAASPAPGPADARAGLAIPRSLPPCRRQRRRARRSARSQARTNDLEARQDDGHTRPRGRPGANVPQQRHSARRAPHTPRKGPTEHLDTKRLSIWSAVCSIIVTILAVPKEQSVSVRDVVSAIVVRAAATLRHGRRIQNDRPRLHLCHQRREIPGLLR
jgi:hypothetical protein